jgi:hypothetical protein
VGNPRATRKRKRRTRYLNAPSPAEVEWLSGKQQEGANRFWKHLRGAKKVERCRWLIKQYRQLIPRGRMTTLERDIQHWEKR